MDACAVPVESSVGFGPNRASDSIGPTKVPRFGVAQTSDRLRRQLRSFLAMAARMPTPTSAVYDYIVRELVPGDHEPDEAAITIVCEPLSAAGATGATGACGTLSMRLKAGTTPDEARAIASLLQAKVKGLCHLEASGDEAA